MCALGTHKTLEIIGEFGKRRWADRKTDVVPMTYNRSPPDAPNVT